MLRTILRSSAFWAAVITALCNVVAQFVPVFKPIAEQIVIPAVTYIIYRLFGNTAKAVIPPTS